MKKPFLFLLILINVKAFSQYSSYYNVNADINVNANIEVNHNINGNVFEYKTIKTIDYGALSLANAQVGKNRLEKQKFEDEKEKVIAKEVIENPIKAFDYGKWFTISSKDENWFKTKERKQSLMRIKKEIGFSEFKVRYVIPYNFFTSLNGYNLQNVSTEGVKTDIFIQLPEYNIKKDTIDIEKEFDSSVVGKEIDIQDEQNKIKKILFHKKELNRATVFGIKGYRSTYIWEDKFEYCITENYSQFVETLGNGYLIFVKVRYYGNKSEVGFEKLEGRRYYLKSLIEKIISTAKISDLKIK